MTDDDDCKSFGDAVTPEDSLDDASRRELFKRLARVGAAGTPVTIALLSAQDASANTGSGGPFNRNPTPGIAWGS